MEKIVNSREVFYLQRNGDLTEGRGPIWHDTPCDSIYTAKRLGKGKCVQGGDCRVIKGLAFQIDGKWYYHNKLNLPNADDVKKDALDRERKQKRDAYLEVISKAEKLGLTEEDVEILKQGC